MSRNARNHKYNINICCFGIFVAFESAHFSRIGVVVRALAPQQWPARFNFPTSVIMWTEFVGCLLCSERFFPGYSGFHLSPKTNI